MLSRAGKRAWASWRRFAADRRGGVLAEAAILLPVLTALLLSGVEVGRFTLLQQKLNRTATSMSDLIAQTDSTITLTQVANLYQAADYVMRPFDLTQDGVVIVSSVSQTAGAASVDWQCIGDSGITAISSLGVSGGTATLPTGFILRDGESAIFAEVVYDFVPFVAPDVIGTKTVRHQAMFRPRFGALSSLAPGTVPAGAPTCTP